MAIKNPSFLVVFFLIFRPSNSLPLEQTISSSRTWLIFLFSSPSPLFISYQHYPPILHLLPTTSTLRKDQVSTHIVRSLRTSTSTPCNTVSTSTPSFAIVSTSDSTVASTTHTTITAKTTV